MLAEVVELMKKIQQALWKQGAGLPLGSMSYAEVRAHDDRGPSGKKQYSGLMWWSEELGV